MGFGKKVKRLIRLIFKLGLDQSLSQLESFYFYIEYGLEEMYQEELARRDAEHVIQDPEHLFGQTG